jgi:clan AA aspartic protease
MGLTHAKLTLTNPFQNRNLDIEALVDTGAIGICITEAQARQLGYDLDEAQAVIVTLADGSQREVPKIPYIGIAFENRTCSTDAFVLGNQALLGVVPLELMDILVDPKLNRLIVNPAHPNVPVLLAKHVD